MKRKLFNFKNTFIVVCFFVFTSTAFASHFRYGDISYRVDPDDPTGKTIIFKANTVWRADWTSSVDLEIYNQGGQRIGVIPQSLVSTSNGVKYYTGELSYTFQNTGIHTVFYGGCCKISNLQNNSDRGWYVFTTIDVGSNNNSPVTSLPALTNVQQNTNATFNIPAVDSDGDNLTYRLATSQDGLGSQFTQPQGFSVSSNGVATFNTNGKNIGELYNAAVVIADSNGAEILVDFIMEIVEQSNPPQWDYSNTPVDGFTYQTSPNQQVSFTIKASDPDPGSSVSISASGMPTGASISPDFDTNGNPIEHTFTWTPTSNQFGQYLINFTAKDNNNVTSSTSVSINVSLKPVFDVPPTPVSGAHNIIVSPGDLIEYTVQASDPDPNDVVQIVNVEGKDMMGNKIPLYNGASFSSLPTQAANPTSGVFSWTPTQQQWGHRHVFFTARDSYGEETIHEVSQLVNTPPSFTSNPILNVFVDDAYSYSINISDPDLPLGDEVSIYGINLPNWLTLTDNEDGTALLTGTPSANDEGTFNISIKAEDKNHHMDTRGVIYQDYILTVVLDNTPPVITLTGDNLQITELGNTYTELGATATDNIDDNTTLTQNISIDASNVNTSKLGSYTVTYDVSDAAGNVATQVTRTVNVTDTKPPAVVTQDITVQLDANGNASITPQDVNNGSNDTSGIASLNVSPSTFNCSNVGAGTCNANSSHALSFTGPVNTGININPSNYDKFTFEAWIYPTRVNYGARQAIFSHDDCCYDRGLVIENNTSTFLVAAGGQTWYPASVDYNQWQHVAVVYDNSAQSVKFYKNGVEYVFQGNTNFSDSNKPMWLAGNPSFNEYWQGRMDDVRVWNVARSASEVNENSTLCVNSNTSGLIHYYDFEEGTGSSATDRVGSNNLSLSNTTWVSGTPNLVGNTGNTVTLTVTDGAGNTATATAIVTVEDNISPTISVIGDASVTHEVLTTYTDLGATTTDNCSATLTVTDDIDVNTLGTYTVTYTATDTSGNVTLATRTVEVVDTTIPVITLTGDNPQIIDLNTTYTELGATAADNDDGDITNDIVIDNTLVNMSAINSYPVTYNVTDTSGNQATELTRMVFVLEPGEPLAKDDSFTVVKNTQNNTFSIVGNDSYGTDGSRTENPISLFGNYTRKGGELHIVGNTVTYTPRSGFTGADSFRYLITDADGDASQATVNITVTEEDTPTALDDTAATDQDTMIFIAVLDNDNFGTDNQNSTTPLSLPSAITTEGGNIVVSNEVIGYTPSSGFSGTDTFSYVITDGNGDTATAVVTVEVEAAAVPNDNLRGRPDTFTAEQNSINNTLNVLADNGSGADSFGSNGAIDDGLTLPNGTTSGNSDKGGTLTINQKGTTSPLDDVFIYTPKANFFGEDQFKYMLTDANGQTHITIARITVNELGTPTAVDDSAEVSQDGGVIFMDVLANDSFGANGANATLPLSVSSITSAQGGSLVVSGLEILYTPLSGFSGQDTFTYTITDTNNNTATATVTVTVGAINNTNDDEPTAQDDTLSVPENSVAFVIEILADNGFGADSFGTDGQNVDHPVSLFSYYTGKGAALAIVGTAVTYTPRPGFTGSDSFRYLITDSDGDASQATVNITVTEQDTPTAVTDTAATDQDTMVVIAVLDNDNFGADGPNGTTPLSLSSVITTEAGSVVLSNGAIAYTPANGFTGIDTFSYIITDGNDDTATAVVTVEVEAASVSNVNLRGRPDTFTVNQNSINNTLNVLADNGSGVDSFGPNGAVDNGLTLPNGTTSGNSDKGGTLTIDQKGTPSPLDDVFIYTPKVNFFGDDQFKYMLTDVNGQTHITIASITVNELGNPTAIDDSVSVLQDSGVKSIDVLFNDTFGSNAKNVTTPLSVSFATSTQGANVVVNNRGEISYTPLSGFSGQDSFTYTIADASGNISEAKVNITVTATSFSKSEDTLSSFGGVNTGNNFTAYPNPSAGYVKTTVFSTTNTNAEILLFDITGKVIFRKQTSLTMGKNELELNLNVKSGIMLLRVQSSETNYGTTKIVFK